MKYSNARKTLEKIGFKITEGVEFNRMTTSVIKNRFIGVLKNGGVDSVAVIYVASGHCNLYFNTLKKAIEYVMKG